MQQVYITVDRNWRGLGNIPQSGLMLASEFADWNAELKSNVQAVNTQEPVACRSGDVLQG